MRTVLFSAIALAGATTTLPALAATRQVVGTLQFEDMTFDGQNTSLAAVRPIRNVTVTLKVGSTTVGTAVTGSNGGYSVWIDQTKLPAGQTLQLSFQSKNFASDVYLDLDWENDRRSWGSSVIIPSGSNAITVGKTVAGWDMAQHFSILDAIQLGREYANARREGADDIGCVDVQYPDADWSNYSNYWEEITISGHPAYGYGGDGEHGWNDQVVLHEYGHHLEKRISDTDSDGGSHSDCTDNGYGFAWSEGWATFFAYAVRFTNPAGVTEGFSELEQTPTCPTPGTEAITRSVMWDLFDGGGNEAFDRVNGANLVGGKTIRDMLFGIFDVEQDDVYCYSSPYQYCVDPTTGLPSFHNHWVNRNLYSGSHADLDRIYAAHGVFPHALSDYSVSTITRSPSGNAVTGASLTLSATLLNSGGVAYADEQLAVRMTVWPSGGNEITLASFTTPNFTGSKTVSRTVTVPTSLQQGTQFFFVYVDPLDRFPESNESNGVLATAIPVVVCGNGTCNAGESCSTCAADCGSCCGNGVCSGSETCASCSADCGACGGCGDGFCTSGETAANCPDDCGSEGTCFVAGTPIAMADGSEKAIEAVAVGDEVLSYDTERGVVVVGTVTQTFVHDDADHLVEIGNGLVTTTMHRFWSDGRWVAAEDLNVGSGLLSLAQVGEPSETASTKPVVVDAIGSLEGRVRTYNFEVAEYHDYFAGGVLVHNIKNQP